MKKKEYLEYRDEPLVGILDFKGLRKSIKDFKEEYVIEILKRFHVYEKKFKCEIFMPISPYENLGPTDTGTYNIGVFSTALCLETIAAYYKNVDECKANIDGNDWVWRNKEKRTGKDRRCTVLSNIKERRKAKEKRKEINNTYGKEKAYQYFEFVVNGLAGSYSVEYGFLAKIATLVRFCNYLSHWEIKDSFVSNLNKEETKNKFREICLDCILEFDHRLSRQKESIHPFELYRFLQFVDKWGEEIWNTLKDSEAWGVYALAKSSKGQLKGEISMHKTRLKELIKRLDSFSKQRITADGVDSKNSDDSGNCHRLIFNYFFIEVYLFAKYELYRQMSLKQSGDSKLYDPKRLIYALLTVYLDNKFSNTLVRNKALELIFSPYSIDRNATWATGQQVAMSKAGLMIITDNECACDLLGCEALNLSLLGFITELKYIYDGYARTKRMDQGRILGWYPIQQRDKTPTSWSTAFTLSFIKRFCKLISLELSRKAKERFRSNYRKPDIGWGDLYDCTAVKAKIRLMFPEEPGAGENGNIVNQCKYRTAILFGPPGSGKTTYGRALATKLGLDYLELTPSDFFSGGENSILVTINDIFEHLLHLKNTVVFIDEIDDLVKDRNQDPNQPYDRRSLFVNSLLPRFQELHDNQNIILIMATNNIERVDRAISRMGRVDLVIPVGAISPHGRLKYFNEFQKKHKKAFDMLKIPPNNSDFEIEFLNATEAFNYSTLKHYSEMILDEIKVAMAGDEGTVLNRITELLKHEAGKKDENNTMLIWQKMVIKESDSQKDYSYDTRPKCSVGDFQDFRHFDLIKFPETKLQFQKDFVKLFNDLRKEAITKDDAKSIADTIRNYCSSFTMKESKTKKSEQCDDIFYNILTPFYDDIDEAINRCDNVELQEELISAQKELMKLIFGRTMLAT